MFEKCGCVNVIGLEEKFVAFLTLKFLYFKNFYILQN